MRLLLLSLAFLPFAAFAHGDTPSLEAEVNGYLIDIGYEHDPVVGEQLDFDIDLYRVGPPMAYAPFADVDIRVTRDGAELTHGSVQNDGVHVPMFAVTFPKEGGYDMDVRFLKDDDSLIVARTFHLEVLPASAMSMRTAEDILHYVAAAGLLALSIGIAGYSLWKRFGPGAKK